MSSSRTALLDMVVHNTILLRDSLQLQKKREEEEINRISSCSNTLPNPANGASMCIEKPAWVALVTFLQLTNPHYSNTLEKMKDIRSGVMDISEASWIMKEVGNLFAKYGDIDVQIYMTREEHIQVGDCTVMVGYSLAQPFGPDVPVFCYSSEIITASPHEERILQEKISFSNCSGLTCIRAGTDLCLYRGVRHLKKPMFSGFFRGQKTS